MQTVNENVPATKVVKVSELRTANDILDQALFMGVQNGRGFKTTYGNIKNQIFQQVSESIKSQLKALESKTASEMSSISMKVSDLSGKLSENVLALQNQDRKAQAGLNALSTSYSSSSKKTDSNISSIQQQQKNFAGKLNSLDVKTGIISTAANQTIGIYVSEIKEEKQNIKTMLQTFKSEIESSISALEEKMKAISCYVEENIKSNEQEG